MRPHFPVLNLILALTALCVIIVLPPGQDGGTSPNKKPYVPTGDEVTLSGTIRLTGKRPKPSKIDMAADVVCYQVNPDPETEDVVGSKGKLANVFIYVKSEVLDSYKFEQTASPATLEHKGCRYVPHVLGIRVGQRLTIINRDPTYHNTYTTPRSNPEWNQSQGPKSPPLKKSFDQPELISFTDIQHPWQRAYVAVFPHPFFAVSDEDGNYRIKGLPPGRYTLVFHHETFGEKAVDVTLVSREAKELDLSFEAEGH